MLEPVRLFLQQRLKNGCWFPALQKLIDILYRRACFGNYFIRWLHDDSDPKQRKGPVGAAELYVPIMVVIGLAWSALLGNASVPPLATYLVRSFAALLAMYRVFEIEIISLHWVFVAEGALHAERRSLALLPSQSC